MHPYRPIAKGANALLFSINSGCVVHLSGMNSLGLTQAFGAVVTLAIATDCGLNKTYIAE